MIRKWKNTSVDEIYEYAKFLLEAKSQKIKFDIVERGVFKYEDVIWGCSVTHR